MRKYLIFLSLAIPATFISNIVFSQNYDDNPEANRINRRPVPEMTNNGFKRENLFVGGDLTVSFFSRGSVLGGSPMVGYKVNDYVDAGVVANFLYTGQRDYNYANDKMRSYVYGPGIFMRAYPVPFLYAQAQLEHNFITQKYIPASGSSYTYSVNAPSLLLGAGYASGRVKGGNTFFYFSVLFDVLKNANSPYVNRNSNGSVVLQPLIRAGVNIGLFQGRDRYNDEY